MSLATYSVARIDLSCNVTADNATEAHVATIRTKLTAAFAQTVGYVAASSNASVPAAGCYGAACALGNIVADAASAAAQADLALVNSGVIAAGLTLSPTANPAGVRGVTRASLAGMVPHIQEVVRLEGITGHQIHLALAHSVGLLLGTPLSRGTSGTPQNAATKTEFLQVSSALRFEWHRESDNITVSKVQIQTTQTTNKTTTAGNSTEEWQLLDKDALYSVATTSFVAGGGGGYTMLTPQGRPVLQTGVTVYSAVEAYLKKTTPSRPIRITTAARITENPRVRIIQLGLLCAELEGPGREKCDQIVNIVHALNDKSNQFFDSILPNIKIVVERAHCGCVAGLMPAAMSHLFRALPNMSAVIGPTCSSDVQAALKWMVPRNLSTTIITPESTAAPLADEQLYPNLARYTASENSLTRGAVELMLHYKWKRVGILADNSVWAKSTKDVFIATLKAKIPDVIITNEDSMTFSHFSIRDGTLKPSELLARLDNTSTKICLLITQDDVQRDIFAAVWQTKLLYGRGFAWITAWATHTAFYNKDGTVNVDAVRGAEGSLGFGEGVDFSGSVSTTYTRTWAANSNAGACSQPYHPDGPFCDGDGDPSTYLDRSAHGCDAVIGFAKAVSSLIGNDHKINASSIYRELLAMKPFDGVSGKNVTLDPVSGDRINGLWLQNMQVQQQHQRQRRLIPLQAVEAKFNKVGEFDPRLVPLRGVQFDHGSKVMFPGATEDIPSDGTVLMKQVAHAANVLNWELPVVIVMVSLVVLLLLVALLYRYQAKRHRNRAHNFGLDLQRLVASGDLDANEAKSCIPREIKRSSVTLISQLGEGAFGEVHKATLDESRSIGGVPAYLVAAKVVKDRGKDHAEVQVATRQLICEAAVMATVRSTLRANQSCSGFFF